MANSKILIVGGTGYFGKYVANASIALGHPTFVLVRPSSIAQPAKAALIDSWKSRGATVLHGSLEDHASLVEAVKLVDVVISTVGGSQLFDQLKLVEAIKEAGTVKRFFPSEFGLDAENFKKPVEEQILKVLDYLEHKITVRRATEAAGIPYTYVSSISFSGYFLSNLMQLGQTSPPRDKVVVYGDGNTKAIFVNEEDVATYTIKAVDDPRAAKKTLYIRPPDNILTLNEIVTLWERKICKTLEKSTLSREEILKQIEDTPYPNNVSIAFNYVILVRGDQTNFEIGPNGEEATKLFPEVKYVTAESYLDQFL